MAKRKDAKKKNHVSKHILKSRDDDTAAGSEKGKSKGKSKANVHTKHPDEAASYLTQWKASKSEDTSVRARSSWKFNKNTQSWLIRHMYEADKIPKTSFLILLEYLEGLEGKFIIDRMRNDALRRCRRHKECCKSNSVSSTAGIQEDKAVENENRGDTIENDNDEVKGKITEPTITNTTAESKSELEHDEALWRKMDDHEKRKQYKRARKILDLVRKGGE
mmetsp:Transcript_6690/g.13801  ORF Transcript_6690/g.13801 Transcript_6690/m.13801 type:complete len:220 (+) Transcript_6690:102-761(+)